VRPRLRCHWYQRGRKCWVRWGAHLDRGGRFVEQDETGRVGNFALGLPEDRTGDGLPRGWISEPPRGTAIHLVTVAPGFPTGRQERDLRMLDAILADLPLVDRAPVDLRLLEIGVEGARLGETVVGRQAGVGRIPSAADRTDATAVLVPVQTGGDPDLPEVVEALGFPGPLRAAREGRQEHAGQDADDRDHHQELDQGEPPAARSRSGTGRIRAGQGGRAHAERGEGTQ
jgi:hypothetical protein